jgi:hypothetical protein
VYYFIALWHDVNVEAVPCKSVAEHLGLRIHQRETFRGWSVSFIYPILKEKQD